MLGLLWTKASPDKVLADLDQIVEFRVTSRVLF